MNVLKHTETFRGWDFIVRLRVDLAFQNFREEFSLQPQGSVFQEPSWKIAELLHLPRIVSEDLTVKVTVFF